MNKNLVPYRLNSHFNEVADHVTYTDSFNGVKLYKTNCPSFVADNIPVTDVNLYFLEEKLITVYLHLENRLEHLETLVKMLTILLESAATISRSQFGIKHKWNIHEEVLVLVKDQIHRKFYLYYSLKKYDVY